MSISTLSALRTALEQAVVLPVGIDPASVSAAGRLLSTWSGSAPATSEALTRASSGALTPSRSANRLLATDVSREGDAPMLLVDRIVQSAGLSGTSTARQTAGLPTTALPRHASGDGVMAYVTNWSAVGSTATTATIEYTNQDGVAKTTTMSLGGSGDRDVNAMLPVPLAAGDRGVRSIEAVTLAATTGTAGNFGFVLAKPVAIIETSRAEPLNGRGPLLTGFASDAALDIWLLTLTTAPKSFAGALFFGED